jgi:hypothetical protein
MSHPACQIIMIKFCIASLYVNYIACAVSLEEVSFSQLKDKLRDGQSLLILTY